MADLKTNYKNDLLDISINTKRKYTMTTNADGTVSFDDATTYTQVGDSFGAQDINGTNAQVNLLANEIDEQSEKISEKLDASKIVILESDIGEGTTVSYPDGTIIFCKG